MANNGPSFTKATYDKKFTKAPALSPDKAKALHDENVRETDKSRKFHQRVTAVGYIEAMFPGKFPPKKPLRRI